MGEEARVVTLCSTLLRNLRYLHWPLGRPHLVDQAVFISSKSLPWGAAYCSIFGETKSVLHVVV